jgi:hypothetical protein
MQSMQESQAATTTLEEALEVVKQEKKETKKKKKKVQKEAVALNKDDPPPGYKNMENNGQCEGCVGDSIPCTVEIDKLIMLSRADLPAPRHLLHPPAAHLLDHFPALPHCSALRSDFPAPCSIPLTPLIYFPPLPTALRHLSNTPTSCLRLSRGFADLLDRSAHRSDFPAVHFLFLYLSSCSPTLPITCRSSPALRPHSSDFPTTSPTAFSALSRRSDFPAVQFRHNNHSPTTLSFILLFHTLYYCS